MTPNGVDTVHGVIARLRELIAVLARRTPRSERTSKRQSAADSAALREEAVERIAQLEIASSPREFEMCARPPLRLRPARRALRLRRSHGVAELIPLRHRRE